MRSQEKLLMTNELFILGDSISIHYTPYLRAFLSPEWKVVRKGEIAAPEIPGEVDKENGTDSGVVLRYLQTILPRMDAKVILLNAGLHDVKRLPTDNDPCQVSLQQYKRYLHEIIDLISAAGKMMIWVTTTPVDDERHRQFEKGFFRFDQDVLQYNRASSEIMRKHGIRIIDLGSFTKKLETPLYIDHVHFTERIRVLQAAFLAGSINMFSAMKEDWYLK